jgi:hypothetical protein
MSWTAVMPRHGRDTCAITRLAIAQCMLNARRQVFTGGDEVTDRKRAYHIEMAALDNEVFATRRKLRQAREARRLVRDQAIGGARNPQVETRRHAPCSRLSN